MRPLCKLPEIGNKVVLIAEQVSQVYSGKSPCPLSIS